MIDWPRTFHRTGRDADPIARACPIESYAPPRPLARWLITAAIVGALMALAVHIAR